MPLKSNSLAVSLLAVPLLALASAPATPQKPNTGITNKRMQITFEPTQTETKISGDFLKFIAPDLPKDWSDYNFLVLEFRASSSERFQLELFANDGPNNSEVMVAKRISPFQNAWVRAAIPLDFFRKPARDGFDLAATFNKHRNSYWININFGGYAPCKNVTTLGFQMEAPYPVNGKPPTLEIRFIQLAKEDPGDAVLDPAKVVDTFGQWIPTDWPTKARRIEDLQKAWAAEDAALKPGNFNYDTYGGYNNTAAPSPTGKKFFRVQRIDNKWWFVDPDNNLFYSAGLNGIGTASATPSANRAAIFEASAPPTGGAAVFRDDSIPASDARSFYTANILRRFGQNARGLEAWGQLTFRRLDAWGFNTVAGFAAGPEPVIAQNGNRKPYTAMLRNWVGAATNTTIMGLPDVYSDSFAQSADDAAKAQCEPLKDDPYLLGYFVGNEPPWPNRESLLCDAILAGPDSATKTNLQTFLKAGDTPARRKQFAYDTFDKYLSIITAAIKRHDPNHLTLGIRLGGQVSDEVYKAARIFDVCSINIYDFAIDPDLLNKIAALTGRPLLVGEFHFGTPTHGLSGGLRQVASQKDRGLAYAYYVEHAASHPSIIGTHWFQWLDQPVTGRNDGENYNIGLIDVTDQPYQDLVSAMTQTHQRLFDIHSKKIPPTDKLPEGRSTAEIQLKNTTEIPPPK